MADEIGRESHPDTVGPARVTEDGSDPGPDSDGSPGVDPAGDLSADINAGLSADVNAELTEALLSAVGDDGGVGWAVGEAAEPEPTALACLALDDGRCREWLVEHQSPSGGFDLVAGPVTNVAATALGALALSDGDARERALDAAVTGRSKIPDDGEDDPVAWGWTEETYSWVEPTSRVLLALRLLRPGDTIHIQEGAEMLAEREVPGGGWNYGNSSALGTDLKPYAQTTAVAVLALQGLGALAERGARRLIELASEEGAGLTLAQAICALRLVDDDSWTQLLDPLRASWKKTRFLGNLGSLAWAVIASGDRVEVLRVAR